MKIDTSLIAQAAVSTAIGAVQSNPNQTENGSNSYIANLSQSGVYRVVYVEHVGDTRGDPWYTNLSCFADDGNALMGDENKIAVP